MPGSANRLTPLWMPGMAAASFAIRIVEDTLLHFDAERYRLMEWVIMPNHVHLLAELFAGSLLSEVVKSWRSFSAHEASHILGRLGQFWQEEYFDRFVRDDIHFENARRYIRENPVHASLVKHPEDWPSGNNNGETIP
jgi:putative transposase